MSSLARKPNPVSLLRSAGTVQPGSHARAAATTQGEEQLEALKIEAGHESTLAGNSSWNRLRRLRSRAPAAPGGAEHLARGRGTAPGDATETCAWTRNYKGDLYSAVCFSILITSGSIKDAM
ncbi:hypothetical protein ABFV05_020084 [Capra hircus]